MTICVLDFIVESLGNIYIYRRLRLPCWGYSDLSSP